jgi:hypothetical protein
VLTTLTGEKQNRSTTEVAGLTFHRIDQDTSKWKRARTRAGRKLRKIADEQKFELIVYALGRREDGIAYYLVVTDHSAYICGFFRDEAGAKWAGCECWGGLNDNHCYHVEAAMPKHVLWAKIEKDSGLAALKLSEFAVAALKPLLRSAGSINGHAGHTI